MCGGVKVGTWRERSKGLEADALPEYMATLGAGDSYHIAVLSPAGLTTMARFDHITGDPDALVRDIAGVLERLAPVYA